MTAYLDNAATTKPSDAAVEQMMAAMSQGYFNPSALYAPAIRTEKALDRVRAQIRAQLTAKADAAVLFTSGGTEANNLAILGAAAMWRDKGHIISCLAEHPSVRETVQALEGDGHRITLLVPNADGSLPYDELESALDQDGPTLVSLMAVNNETGAVLDIQRMSDAVRRRAPGALIHVDGVQGFMRTPIDMRLIDMYTLSAHKIHGPKGVGALVVNKGIRLKPRQLGGGQQSGLRSGTENVPGILGLGGAIEHMGSIEGLVDALRGQKRRFHDAVMSAVPDAVVNGPDVDSGAPHIINMSFPGVRGEVLLHALEGDEVYCSTGSACSSKKLKVSPVLIAMGLSPSRAEAALRFSFSPDTTDDEIDYAAGCIARHVAVLARFKRR